MPAVLITDFQRVVKLDEQVLTNVTSYTSPAWSPGQYRSLYFNLYVSNTSAVTQPMITLQNQTGTYRTQITYSSGASAAGFNDPANWNTGILTTGELTATILLAPGQSRAFLGQAISGSTAFTVSAENNTSPDSPTALIVTFTGASSGRIELWGWQL